MAYSRIAFAQISANPAYVDESGVSHLHEPAFPSEEKIGLHTLAGIEEVNRFRTAVADTYTHHISAKIEIVCAFAHNKGAEIIVFPEYSVPSRVLNACKQLSDGFGLVIVAGSHVATRHSVQDYHTLGLQIGDDVIGRAVCPVFCPGRLPWLCEKLTRSKWESSLIVGKSCEPLEVTLGGKRTELQVFVCLDAISESAPKKGRAKRSTPTLNVIPSLSPKVEPFYDRAKLLLASEMTTLFVNVAEFGGSRAFARTENATAWRTDADGTEPLPAFVEAVVTLEVDLASQYQVRRTTQEHFPVGKIDVFPLLYPDSSPMAQEYADLIEQLRAVAPSSIPDIKAKIERYAILDPRLFPPLLQQKISHFLQHVVGAGLENDETWLRWLEPVIVKSTDSTDALRWELCGTGLQLLNELMLSGKYQDKTEQLTAVYRYLVNRRKELGRNISAGPTSTRAPTASEAIPAAAGVITSFEPPFYDRENDLANIRRFVESSEQTCLVVGGMRGIGKTSLAKEVFRKVLPPTWKNIWVELTEGTGYARLLAEIAFRCRIRVPIELHSEAAQVEILQNVLLYFAQTPRIVLVVDDLQYLMDPSGDLAETKIGTLLSELIRRASSNRNKLLLISTIIPRFHESLRSRVEVRYLQGLEKKYAEDVLSFWFGFEREDLRGQAVSFPDSLFRVLAGHPLGLRIAARMWAENPFPEEDLSIFKKLRETVVACILDRVNLTAQEQEFLTFASVFRLPVGRDVFLKWHKDDAAFLIDSLIGRSFLETDTDKYRLHPLIREHFYNLASTATLKPFHRLAAAYFLDVYTKAKSSGAGPDPEMLGEAIHHFLAAGEREKVRSFGLYRSELKPIARDHYHKGEYDQAIKDYSLLVQLDASDADAHFHLALIQAKQHKWDDAEAHFGKAISINPKAFWIFQGYAHVKLNANRVLEAEHLLDKAEELKERHSPTLVDLGRLREREGRVEEAEDYFKRAIDADENNAFAYYAYAKFLLQQGRYDEGLGHALAALEVNPRNSQNRDLVRDLRSRVQEARRKATGGGALSATKRWDVFISHASEDKAECARPLAEALTAKGVRVWYDEFSLRLGDSLRTVIEEGLANSRYGVVIISKNFFAKKWPTDELNGLATKEINGQKVILPVWHKITAEQVRSFSPILADRFAAKSDEGIVSVVDKILEVLNGPRS